MRIPWAAIGVSIIIVIIAASQLDVGKLADAITRVNPVYLGAAMTIWAIMVVLKVIKWMAVIRAIDGHVSPKESFIALMVGLFVGVMTPGRIGLPRSILIKPKIN